MNGSAWLDVGALQTLARRKGRAGAHDVMGAFLTSTPDPVENLRLAASQGRDADVRLLAHRLRQNLERLGGRRAACVAAEIETSGAGPGLDEQLRELGAEVAAVQFFLRTCGTAASARAPGR